MTKAVLSGGGGFLGAHVCHVLVARGWDVVALDNLLTGRTAKVADLLRIAEV